MFDIQDENTDFCVEIFQRFRYSLGVFGSSKLYLSVPLLPLIPRLRGYYDFDDGSVGNQVRLIVLKFH